MDSLQVSIFTTAEGIEAVAGKLYSMDLTQLEIVDDVEEIKAILEASRQYWDYVDYEELLKNHGQPCVKVYVADDEVGRKTVEDICAALAELKDADVGVDLGGLQVTLQKVREDDWANNWRQYFKPVPVGERLLIQPAWEELAAPTDRTVLKIEPGMVFGTGQHETTALCLALLEQYVRPGDRVLDAGCGSGILSIGALLLGAGWALGVDIDPNAVKIVRENGRLNGLEADRLQALSGNIIEDEPLREQVGGGYDLVLANIVADVILALCPLTPGFIKPGGIFITSGIISMRLPEVERALAQRGFTVLQVVRKNDWVAVASRYTGGNG
ncbi:MAG: 50S ribosomal protein L11 methyltransferase [Christensenellales bacterium]|jgi:ribosomal protein L11 methyltransferase